MITDADVESAAREFVERHGSNVLAMARERVDELMRSKDQPALAVALRVLSACERLTKEGRDEGAGR